MNRKSKNNLTFYFSLIVIFLSLIFFYVSFGFENIKVEIISGNCVLSEDLIDNNVFKLQGEAYYHDEKFIDISENSSGRLVYIPNKFENLNKNKNVFGYGTLSFNVEIPDKYIGREFGFKTQNLSTAAQIWINGKKVAEQGIIGKDKESTKGIYYPLVSHFRADNKMINISIKLANFQDLEPLVNGFYIGLNNNINKLATRAIAKDMFLTGALITMFIKYLFLFFRRETEAQYFYFSILCLMMAIRNMLIGERFLIQVYTNMPWQIFERSVLIALYVSTWMYIGFTAKIFENFYNEKLMRIYRNTIMSIIILTISMPSAIYNLLLIPFLILIVIYLIYNLYIANKYCGRDKYKGNVLKLIYFIVLFTVIHDILNAYSLIDSIPIVSLGIFLLIVLIANLLSSNISVELLEKEKLLVDTNILNEKLEIKVMERTREIQIKNQELILMNRKLEYLSKVDELTGIFNRRSLSSKFLELLENEFSEENLNLALVDIDYFKNYNDHYGHIEGDKCLVTIANELKQCIDRDHGFVFRYGGEEFVILKKGLSAYEMAQYMKNLVKRIEFLEIKHEKSLINKYVTISAGVITKPIKEIESAEEFLEEADELLYEAKKNGKNCIEWQWRNKYK